ncbi:hypothetical protein NIIDMKKI_79440 [Mycobacterium kansasii]|uniref:Uncharacterized protein n=1 Tax=Mycobacterium kansasii TaxID=1768 RepID=A0A7G1IVA2_MYCKA|nr:hypothetical protein NIIDMKKI_79440 [Mycobacterium kansasii]
MTTSMPAAPVNPDVGASGGGRCNPSIQNGDSIIMTQPTDDDQAAGSPGLVRCSNCGRYGWHTTDRCADADRYVCAPWCTDGSGHPSDVFLDDQECSGPQHKVVLSLEDGVPALPIAPADLHSAPGITVYASQRWYRLPTITANVFVLRGAIDYDLTLTPSEAVELARALVGAVELIAGGQR